MSEYPAACNGRITGTLNSFFFVNVGVGHLQRGKVDRFLWNFTKFVFMGALPNSNHRHQLQAHIKLFTSFLYKVGINLLNI